MKKLISLVLAAILLISSLSACAEEQTPFDKEFVSDDAAGAYVDFLEKNLTEKPKALAIGYEDSAAEYGVDISDLSNDGFVTRAKEGKVLILGKTDEGLDRAVRDFVKYGNSESYDKTYGKGYRVKRLTIAGNDISEYAIIYDSVNQSGAEEPVFAAEQLSMYIEKTCGATLPYYSDTEFASLDKKPARTITLTVDYPALGNEAFRIEVAEDGNLTIFGGRNKGCIYGVYDLLEENVGWRFYDDVLGIYEFIAWRREGSGAEYLYEAEHIDLTAEINRTEEPLFGSRRMDCDNGNKGAYSTSYTGTSDNAARLYNNYSYKAKISANWYSGHGLSVVHANSPLMIREYYHQPCLTDEDNLKIINEYYLNHLESLVASGYVPGRDYNSVTVGQFDGGHGFCGCKDCRKVINEEGSTSALYLRAANNLAQALKDNGYEDITVNFLAYRETAKAPKKTVPLDNVTVSFCYYILGDMDGCSAHTIDGTKCSDESFSSNKRLKERFEEWVDLFEPGNIDVWYYPYQDGNAIAPAPVILNMYEDIKYLSEKGVNGIINTCCGSSSQFCFLGEYLLNRICWELPESYEEYLEMIREWLWLTYGDAADLIYEYLIKYEEIGKKADCYAMFYYDNLPLNYVKKSDMLENFTYFCDLFDKAHTLVNTSAQEEALEHLEAGMLYMGVIHAYEDWYVNGTEEERALLTEKYTRLHELCTKYRLPMSWGASYDECASAPEELDLDVNPIMWFAEPANAVEKVEEYFANN